MYLYRFLLLTLLITAPAWAWSQSTTASSQSKDAQRAEDAAKTLKEVLRVPEQSIPEKLLRNAEAIIVMPEVVKMGLGIGGRRGKGLLVVRDDKGVWSNPSFVTFTGGSIGLQAGLQTADIILVFKNKKGVENIVNGKFTLGADAAVATGPVGRSAQISTDGQFKAEIFSYSRAKGLFAGIALDGAVLKIDNKANARVYGTGTTARMILENRVRPNLASVIYFRDQIEEATAQAQAAQE